MFCCCLRGACQVGQVVVNGVVHAYVSCALSHLNTFTCWCKNASCAAVLRGAGHIAALFLRCCRPLAATITVSTLLRTTTAVLSHSLARFNYQAFLMDPLSRSPAKRSKTAEVAGNISCQRTLFPETRLCKLCVIPRSRVLRSVWFC